MSVPKLVNLRSPKDQDAAIYIYIYTYIYSIDIYIYVYIYLMNVFMYVICMPSHIITCRQKSHMLCVYRPIYVYIYMYMHTNINSPSFSKDSSLQETAPRDPRP